TRTRELVIAAISTIYTLFLIWAAGVHVPFPRLHPACSGDCSLLPREAGTESEGFHDGGSDRFPHRSGFRGDRHRAARHRCGADLTSYPPFDPYGATRRSRRN